jgi:drug/metabolite transporter (DMT)-like permease
VGAQISPHRRAVLQALLVTGLWSSSWVLIKIGLTDLPALTFAGLRYGLAWLCLLPLALRPGPRAALARLSAADWGWLAALGALYYSVTQGAQFVGLALLPAATVSLLLNLTPLVVGLLGIGLLGERPTPRQWAGVGLAIAGALLYFLPATLPPAATLGVVVVAVGVAANAGSAVLGRRVNRDGLGALVVTVVSMGIGAALLLAIGIAWQGLPPLDARAWGIIAWLALVNTALAFTLWNHTLRTLTAVESSIINGTMLIQIALLAWLALGETLTPRAIAGLALAGLGTLLVQLRKQ